MSALAAQQAALIDALFDWPAQIAMKKIAVCVTDTGARGLKAYQTNGHALAERALRAAYPVVAQLVGEESFADLARALWHAHPPRSGDVARWGYALPRYVAASPQLQDEPYLADVAKVEWALHSCATAANGDPADASSLALLTNLDPQDVFLRLAPGCFTLQSAWPVASILCAHLEQTPSMQEVAVLLQNRAAQGAVVWRQGLRSRVRLAQEGEVAFLSALTQGQALGPAVDATPEFDFGVWFPQAFQTALVLGAHAPMVSHTENENA
jgi:hypothetical protein